MADQTKATAIELKNRYPSTATHICGAPLKDPTNYLGILRQIRLHFKTIRAAHPDADFFIAVSSGTPHMHACWVMLAASGEIPATILQSTPPEFVSEGKSPVKEIDLSSDDFPRITLREESSSIEDNEEGLDEICRELGIFGQDETFLKMIRQVAAYAPYDDTHILLLGETGSGKERVTELLHRLSPRALRSLVSVNCSSLPPELVESQLFGHRKGAFTGAVADHAGKFKTADGGILFLDELGELPLAAQAKLLRVLDQGEIEPVGANQPTKVNVRVVAATNRDIRQMVSEGRFREDLYQRFSAVITLPPLRQRKSDISVLALHLLEEWNRRHKKQRSLSAKALTALTAHPWPGNVRELRRVIAQSAMLTDKSAIGPTDLKFELPITNNARTAIPEPDTGFSLQAYLDAQRSRIIERALEKAEHVQARAARLLGITPQALNQFLKAKNHQP
jgi:transcriptional regulator with GAF, ATPase, and Fis domain